MVPNEPRSLRVEGLELLKGAFRDAIIWPFIGAWSWLSIRLPGLQVWRCKWVGFWRASGFCCRSPCPAASPRTVWRAGDCFSEQARRVIHARTLDWGVLQETGTQGIYTAGTTLWLLMIPRLIAWLAEASLHARAERLGLVTRSD